MPFSRNYESSAFPNPSSKVLFSLPTGVDFTQVADMTLSDDIGNIVLEFSDFSEYVDHDYRYSCESTCGFTNFLYKYYFSTSNALSVGFYTFELKTLSGQSFSKVVKRWIMEADVDKIIVYP